MKKEQLNHLIRAAKDISSKLNFLIIGSQAVIGDAEIYAELEKRASLCLQSPEIDVMTFDVVDNDIQVDEDSTELLEWGLGETSRFFDTFGYYLQADFLIHLVTIYKQFLFVLRNYQTIGN